MGQISLITGGVDRNKRANSPSKPNLHPHSIMAETDIVLFMLRCSERSYGKRRIYYFSCLGYAFSTLCREESSCGGWMDVIISCKSVFGGPGQNRRGIALCTKYRVSREHNALSFGARRAVIEFLHVVAQSIARHSGRIPQLLALA